MKSEFQVLHIIKTSNFFSDGRLLKWIESLAEFQIDSNILIVEDDNLKGDFNYKKGSVKRIKLFSRNFFPQRKGYFFKIPEYSIRTVISILRRPEKIIVFHDMQHYLSLLLLLIYRPKNKKIVWDLHELPHDRLGQNSLSRKILRFILEKIDLLIYTNEERRSYMKNQISYNEKRYVVLRNFPDNNFIQSSNNNLSREVLQWLENKPYILWMGWASEGRNFKTVLEALQDYKEELRLVILGPVEPEMKEAVDKNINEGFIYQKFVPQKEIINYVDNSLFSIVFYKNSSPNNLLCEPNRLYQLLSRNIPVICGINPPMKNIVEKVEGGIILEDDGSDINLLKPAIVDMLKNNERYKENLRQINKEELFSWEEQFERVIESLKELK